MDMDVVGVSSDRARVTELELLTASVLAESVNIRSSAQYNYIHTRGTAQLHEIRNPTRHLVLILESCIAMAYCQLVSTESSLIWNARISPIYRESGTYKTSSINTTRCKAKNQQRLLRADHHSIVDY